MKVAIDASVLVALIDPQDLWRERTVALYDALIAANTIPFYFDCVAAEAVSAASRRLHEKGRSGEVPLLLDRLNHQVSREMLTWILPKVPNVAIGIFRRLRLWPGF